MNWVNIGSGNVFFFSSAPSHYLNQRWFIVNWTLGNKFKWNLNRNSYIFAANVDCKCLPNWPPFCPGGDDLKTLSETKPRQSYLLMVSFIGTRAPVAASLTNKSLLHSLWPSDAMWRQRSGSTLAQVMACCLAAPSHYLNQCWLIISEVLWHSH